MRFEYRQVMRLEQKLLQSPQMIQAMQVLQLSTPELLERIQAELDENPFLELEGEPLEDEAKESTQNNEDKTSPEELELENISFFEGRESLGGSGAAAESGWDPVANLPAPPLTTASGVLEEFRVAETTEEEIHLADAILCLLDSRGFYAEGIQGLASCLGLNEAKVRRGIERMRELVHPALAARDLREAYLLQLHAMPEPHPTAEALIENHFDELLANRLPQIASSLNTSMLAVREALDILALLDSRPLHDESQEESLTILPDLVFEPDGEAFRVRLTRDSLPELRLSDAAREALEKSRADPKVHEFLLKRLERARWFLDAVTQRRHSLIRIAEELAKRQLEFLRSGPEQLAPLRMQEVADAVGVHLSTVSRAVRGKWALTPQGIHSLKSFFSGGQKTTGGGSTSRVAIQQRIREIVDAEDRSAPLSDEELAKVLLDRNGIKVARRTITKYRKMMEIPASHVRRSFS